MPDSTPYGAQTPTGPAPDLQRSGLGRQLAHVEPELGQELVLQKPWQV